MRRSIAVSAVIIGLSAWLLPANPAAADGCGTVTQIDTPGGAIYIDDRGAANGEVWIYHESNGIDGLQAGGTHPVLNYPDRDCPSGGVASDTLLV